MRCVQFLLVYYYYDFVFLFGRHHTHQLGHTTAYVSIFVIRETIKLNNIGNIVAAVILYMFLLK